MSTTSMKTPRPAARNKHLPSGQLFVNGKIVIYVDEKNHSRLKKIAYAQERTMVAQARLYVLRGIQDEEK